MTEDARPQRSLRDPRELRALAHPVRIGIVEQLTLAGALTATELADRLDESPANCSWHLRTLAAYGFVEEAERGGGRKRPWRITSIGLRWDEGETTAEERRAGDALLEMVLQRQLDRFREARQRLRDEEGAWQDASVQIESGTWLTAEEFNGLREELEQLLWRYHERVADPLLRPAGSRLCDFVAWGSPTFLPGLEPEVESEGDPEAGRDAEEEG